MEVFIDNQFNKDFTQQYSLLIEIEAQQLAFILYNKQNTGIAVLKRITFPQKNSSVAFTDQLKAVINGEDLLHVPVKETKISLVGKAFTLVPRMIFEEPLKDNYLQYSAGVQQQEKTAVNYIRPFFIKNVFSLEQALEDYLNHTFATAKIFHCTTTLLEYAALHKEDVSTGQLILDIRQELMYIVYMQDQTLQYCNQFHYKNKEDFLYYILLACDQLSIDRNSCRLILSGYISMDSVLYTELYKFFRTIVFAGAEEYFKLPESEVLIPYHYFNTLLSLHLCES